MTRSNQVATAKEGEDYRLSEMAFVPLSVWCCSTKSFERVRLKPEIYVRAFSQSATAELRCTAITKASSVFPVTRTLVDIILDPRNFSVERNDHIHSRSIHKYLKHCIADLRTRNKWIPIMRIEAHSSPWPSVPPPLVRARLRGV